MGAMITNLETIHIEMIFSYKHRWAFWKKIKMQNWTYNYPQEAGKQNVSNEYRKMPIGEKDESRK